MTPRRVNPAWQPDKAQLEQRQGYARATTTPAVLLAEKVAGMPAYRGAPLNALEQIIRDARG